MTKTTFRTTNGRSPSQRRFRQSWAPFALPALVIVAIFFVVPLVMNIPLAFSSWTTYRSDIRLNGLSNFSLLYDQGSLTNAIRVTVVYGIVAMLVQNLVSLPLAYAMRETTLVNGFFRSLYFLPVLISPLAVGYIWRGIFEPAGPLNQFIGLLIPGFAHPWLGDPDTALYAVAFADAWKWVGLTTLVYIAGINSVPKETLEAAKIDGANAWQSFWMIIFPLLAPAFTFNIVLTLIGSFNAYDVIQATTVGGPGSATRSINVLLYTQWGLGNFGSGSALGLVITFLVFLVGIPLVWFLRKREGM